MTSGGERDVSSKGCGIRLVAVDEDGTFLRDHQGYDVERFERIWGRMAERGCRFVVASGNQYYQIRDLFPAHEHEMGFVSANGAYVLDGGEEVFAARAPREAVEAMIDYAHANPEVPFSMLGVRGAYVERGSSQWFFDDTAVYCHRLFWVDDFRDVDDQVFMFSSVVDGLDEAMVQIARVRDALGGSMEPVSSGDGYFDVVTPGVHKASGLRMLMDRWGISPSEVAAFGDSHNDVEMLRMAGRSYAMAGAPDDVKAVAGHVAPPCEEDGVLRVLEGLFPE
jgi:Cof subfamily protein (haloacid dehalogenase superfamily)